MPTNPSRGRNRERASRYSPAPSKPSSPSETAEDPSGRVLRDATTEDAGFDSQLGRYNYMNFSPGPNVWRADDFRAIALAVFEEKNVRPSVLISADATLPDQLSRKSIADVREAINHLLRAFNEKEIPFAPPRTPLNFLGVLASEYHFMTTHAHERGLALSKLVTSRNNLNEAETIKSNLMRDLNYTTEQIEKEQERRAKSVERKEELENLREEAVVKLEKSRQEVKNLLDTLEKARMNDLEVRRRLDRTNLKVGALRGKMVVPTVAQLLRKESDKLVAENKKADKHTSSRREGNGDAELEEDQSYLRDINNFQSVLCRRSLRDDSSATSTPPSDSSDDTEIDMDEEAMEFRLLKNRLAMVENETGDWKSTLMAERARYQMVARAKTQLEEEIARLKHAQAVKGPAGRINSKLDSRPHAKIRSAVRTSISYGLAESPAPQKTICKGRKSKKPSRSLDPDV